MIENQSPKPDYGQILNIIGPNLKKLFADKVIKQLNIKKGNLILDVGCGSGGDAAYICLKTGAVVIGLDNNTQMLNYSMRSIPVIHGDISNPPTPFGDRIFNAAYSANLLHLLQDKDLAIKEIYRILKHNGKLLLLFTKHEDISKRYINKFFPTLQSVQIKRHLDEVELQKLLCRCKFNFHSAITFRVEDCIIDWNYYDKIKSGLLSSLFLLDEYERERGIKLLKDKIKKFESKGQFPRLKRFKSIIIAEKK